MTNPFDILPLNIFNLFSTQGAISLQRHYMAILLRIYGLAEFNRLGLAREVIVAEIVDYLKGADAEGEVAAEMSNQTGVEPDSVSITGQKSEGITPPTSSAAWKNPAGSSASSTLTTARLSPCPITPLPCSKPSAKLKSKSRTNSRGRFTQHTSSSLLPKPTKTSPPPWP